MKTTFKPIVVHEGTAELFEEVRVWLDDHSVGRVTKDAALRHLMHRLIAEDGAPQPPSHLVSSLQAELC